MPTPVVRSELRRRSGASVGAAELKRVPTAERMRLLLPLVAVVRPIVFLLRHVHADGGAGLRRGRPERTVAAVVPCAVVGRSRATVVVKSGRQLSAVLFAHPVVLLRCLRERLRPERGRCPAESLATAAMIVPTDVTQIATAELRTGSAWCAKQPAKTCAP